MQELGGAFPFEWEVATDCWVASSTSLRLLGFTDGEEPTFEGLLEHVHPNDRDGLLEGQCVALETGGLLDHQFRVTSAEGLRWLRVRARVTYDTQSQPIGLAGVMLDQTERMKSEELLRQRETALAERERFMRNVLASSDDCIKVLDLDASLQFMSEGGMRVMEVEDFSQIEGCSWPSFWSGETAEKAKAAVAAAKDGGAGHFEGFCPTVAGSPRWWDVSVTPIRDEHGKVERLLSISRDITERKLAEKDLHLSQQRLEFALAAGKIGTWVWDIPAGTITADARLADMFGVDPVEAQQGAPASAFVASVHPEDRARVEQIMGEVVQRGGAYEVEHRLLAADGTVKWIIARGECQHDEDGRPVRFPGATVDITDVKRAEEARELITSELAHRIKNIFAVVNGLISFSVRGYPEAKAFAEALRERLTALAQAHEYVRPHSANSRRLDAPSQTFFGLVRLLLKPYLQLGAERVQIEGTDRHIGTKSATALALVLHEQATNAMKYGALSTDNGLIRLTSEESGGCYRLTWEEIGGPKVEREPSRRGFGTELAARSVAGQLGGTLSHEWLNGGLVMRLTIPSDNLLR